MNLQKRTKYAALIISILTASLVNEYLLKLIKAYYEEPTYRSVAIGMLATVIVFVPLFSILNKWINHATKAYISTGKKVTSNSKMGLYISFFIALFILFVLYAKNRHGIDVLGRLSRMI